MSVYVPSAAGDGYRAATGYKVQRAGHITHYASGTHGGGSDGACRLKVPDGGVFDVAERGRHGILRVIADGQRVAVAVEQALKRVALTAACHLRYNDVAGQLHILVDEGVAGVAKIDPFTLTADCVEREQVECKASTDISILGVRHEVRPTSRVLEKKPIRSIFLT